MEGECVSSFSLHIPPLSECEICRVPSHVRSWEGRVNKMVKMLWKLALLLLCLENSTPVRERNTRQTGVHRSSVYHDKPWMWSYGSENGVYFPKYSDTQNTFLLSTKVKDRYVILDQNSQRQGIHYSNSSTTTMMMIFQSAKPHNWNSTQEFQGIWWRWWWACTHAAFTPPRCPVPTASNKISPLDAVVPCK